MPAPLLASDANAPKLCASVAPDDVVGCDPDETAPDFEPIERISFDLLSKRQPGESVVTSALHFRTDIDMDADEPVAASEQAVDTAAVIAPALGVAAGIVAEVGADSKASAVNSARMEPDAPTSMPVSAPASAPAPAEVPPASTTSLSMMPASSGWVSDYVPLRALPVDEPDQPPVNDAAMLIEEPVEPVAASGLVEPADAVEPVQSVEAVELSAPVEAGAASAPVEPVAEPEPDLALIDVQSRAFDVCVPAQVEEIVVTASEQADASFAAELDSFVARRFAPIAAGDLIEDDVRPATPAQLVARIGQALNLRRRRRAADDQRLAGRDSAVAQAQGTVQAGEQGGQRLQPQAVPGRVPTVSSSSQPDPHPVGVGHAPISNHNSLERVALIPPIAVAPSAQGSPASVALPQSTDACAQPAARPAASAPSHAATATPSAPRLVELSATSQPTPLVPAFASVALAVGALGHAWAFSGWPLVGLVTWGVMLLLPGIIAAAQLRKCSQALAPASLSTGRASAAVALAVSGIGWLVWSMLAVSGGWEAWVGAMLSLDAVSLAWRGRGLALDLAEGRYRSWAKASLAGFVFGVTAWLLGDARHGMLGDGSAMEFLSAVRLGEPWLAGLRSVPVGLLVALAFRMKTPENSLENQGSGGPAQKNVW